MNQPTFTNKFKSKRFKHNFRPNINKTFGIPLSFLGIPGITIADRIKQILEIKRSKKYRYCIDTIDEIKYIYDLELFRLTKDQIIGKIDTKLLRDQYKNSEI